MGIGLPSQNCTTSNEQVIPGLTLQILKKYFFVSPFLTLLYQITLPKQVRDCSKAGKDVVKGLRGSKQTAPQPRNRKAHVHAPEPNSTKSRTERI